MFKKIIIAYYYLFYKFYKFWEYVSIPSFWSDWKAGISLMVIEIWMAITIINYYSIFVNRYFHLQKGQAIAIGLFFALVNFLIFERNKNWKLYIDDFDKLPKRKNYVGSWMVFFLIIFILSNLIFSFYLMFQIDWSQYR